MSLTRNIFSSDTPMASYRDELFKGDETKMADPKSHRARYNKLAASSSPPQSARAFQFSAEGSGGDGRKLSQLDGAKSSFAYARNVFEWKDNHVSAPSTNRWDSQHDDRERSSMKRCSAGTLYFSADNANDDEVERSTILNSAAQMPSKGSNDNLRDVINSSKKERTKDWSKERLEDTFTASDEPEVAAKSRERGDDFEMDFIMFLGLTVGVLLSKAFRFISNYSNWILKQATLLRKATCGRYVLVDILNFEDSSKLSMRNKILLLPVFLLYGFLYGSVVLMSCFVQLLLRRAPQKFIATVKKWHAH